MANQVAVDVEVAWPYIQKRLERYLAGAGAASTGSAGGVAVGEHALDGPLHAGFLARSQAPWVASDIASAITNHAALVDVHHARQHDILASADHAVTGGAALDVIGLSAPGTLARLTPSSAPGANSLLLKSSAAGNLTLPTMTATTSLNTPLITTNSNVDLVIDPGGTGAVVFPNAQKLRSATFDSGFPIQGWQINEVAGIAGKSALTIGSISADELFIKYFVADETRIRRGTQYWTYSNGIVSRDFTTPSAVGGTVRVYFENSPAITGAIFVNNDWLMFQYIDNSGGGFTSTFVWGQVSSYINEGNGEQSWLFTLRQGLTSTGLKKGTEAIDFGASGAALIQLSVVDVAGAPYIKMRRWAGANPYTPGNHTTYVQVGDLGGVGNPNVTPAGDGLYARSTADANRFILIDDNGLQIRNAALAVWNGSNNDILIDQDGIRVRAVALNPLDDINAYRFETAAGVTMGGLYGRHFGGNFDIFVQAQGDASNDAYLTLRATGTATNGDANVVLRAANSDTPTREAAIWLDVDGTTSLIRMVDAQAVRFEVPTESYNDHSPFLNLGASLGSAGKKWAVLYVGQVLADTISGTSMSGATWQYPGSMIVDANSATDTTVNVTNSGAGAVVFDVIGQVRQSGTNVSLVGHTHDDRYFTETESDARYVQTVTLGNYVLKAGGTMTGALLAPAGTVSAPAWAFSGSTGTGLYRQAADSLSIATAGVERVRINATGQVSVNGAPVTGYVMTVQPASGQTAGMTLEGTYTTAGFLFNTSAILRHAAATTVQGMRWVPTAEPQGAITTYININNNLRLNNSAFAVTNVRLSQGQFLGQAGYTGAITSLSIFHALNASLGGAAISNQYGYYAADLSGATNNWAFYAAGTTPSFFGGNVGIGNDVPVSQLDVASATGAVLTLRRVDTSLTANDMIGRIQFYAADLSTTTNFIVANIEAQAISTVATDINPGRLIFRTTSAAVAATPAERLRIEGDVAITATLPVLLPAGSLAAPGWAWSAESNSGAYRSGAGAWQLVVGGTAIQTINATGISVTGNVAASANVVAGGQVTTPVVTTASGNLTLSSAGGTVAFGGQALSGTNWSVAATGAASFAPGTDTVHGFGQAQIGFMSGAANNATFAHKDHNSLTRFALMHTTFGDTALNGNTYTGLWVGGAEWAGINSARMLPAGSGLKSLGDYNRKFKDIFVEEIVASTLVAQEVISTIGGDIIVTPTTKLIADIASTAGGIGQSALYTNLVAYWKLQESFGDRYDSKGSNTLTNTNSVGVTTGKIGNASSFVKASSQRLSAADNSALSVGDIDFYVACWVQGTIDDGTSQYIATKSGSSGNRAWYLYFDWATNQVKFRVFDASDNSTTVTASTFGVVTTATWYFVEAWHNAATNQIGVAVNGVGNTSTHTTGSRDETGPFQIGALNSGSHLDGVVDEFGYWKNYIPNSTERTWLYNAGVGRTIENIYVYGVTDITLDVQHNNLRNGEWILLKAAPGGIQQTEKMLVTSSYTSITGGYRYSATRDQDGTGPNNWWKGDAVASQQKNVGEGHLWLTANTSVHGHTGPGLIGYVRTGALVNDIKPVFVKGNLRSFVDYVSDEYGDAAGNDLTLLPTTGYQGYTIDRTNGLRLFNVDFRLYEGAARRAEILPAAGLNLLADDSTTNLRQQINWYRNLDSKSVTPAASLLVYTYGVTNNINLYANRDGANYGASIRLAAGAASLEITETNATTSTGTLTASAWTVVGNVGMGIAPTAMRLEINGSARVAMGSSLYLGGQTDASESGLRLVYSTHAYIDSADGDIVFRADNVAASTERMRIKNGGGIEFATNLGTDWTALPYGALGWGDYGGSYQGGQYKKVGDLVFLRGLVQRVSGGGSVIAVLPSGFRPAAWCLFRVYSSGLGGGDRVDIDTSGNITLVSGGVAYVQLDGLVFSTNG